MFLCRALKRQRNYTLVMHSQGIIIFEVDLIDISHTTRSRFAILKALTTDVKVCNLVNYDHSVNKPCQKCTLKHVHIQEKVHVHVGIACIHEPREANLFLYLELL